MLHPRLLVAPTAALSAACILASCTAHDDPLGDPLAPAPAVGNELSNAPPVQAALVVGVEDFGAVADGVTDDGPAIQAALDFVADKGGGEVYLSAGSYFVDQTLLVGDHTVVRGEDRNTTTLIRGNTATSIGYLHKWIAGSCVQESQVPAYVRSVFVNRDYNCGNVGIELRELGIDGSQVTTLPLAVGVAMSGNRDLVIDRLLMRDMAQDAIFLKNGGQGTTVSNTRIESFNMRWYNGGGINIEMWGDVNYPGGPVLEDNVISAIAPAFCTDDGEQPCDEDSDCAAGVCPVSNQVTGIAVSTQPGASTATPKIIDNEIEVSEGNLGIRCMQCLGSEIERNAIIAVESKSLRSGRMWGMLLGGSDLTVTENLVLGAGVANDLRGILVEGGKDLTFAGNRVERKNIGPGMGSAAVTIRGQEGYTVTDNLIVEIAGATALELGPGGCSGTAPLQGGVVEHNKVQALTHDAIDIRSQHHLRLVNNSIAGTTRAPCGDPARFVFGSETGSGAVDPTAYAFTNADHQVRVDAPHVPASSPFSIVAVVSPDDVAGNGGPLVAQYYDVLDQRMVAFARPSEFGIQIGGTVVSAPATLGDGDWHTVAMTRDDTDTVDLYVDGGWVASAVVSGPIDQQSMTVARADEGPVQSAFIGEIDELWIFDDVLVHDEIDALSSGSMGPEDVGPAYWDFEAFAAAP